MSKDNQINFNKKLAKIKIANKISNALKEQNIKKQDFAMLLNKQNSVISLWLKGEHNFSVDTLIEIEYVLNINLLTQ